MSLFNLFSKNDIPFHFKRNLNHDNYYSWLDVINDGVGLYVANAANAYRSTALRIPNFCESIVSIRV